MWTGGPAVGLPGPRPLYCGVARYRAKASVGRAVPHTLYLDEESPIRALSMSLLAVATIAASVALAHFRTQDRPDADPGPEARAQENRNLSLDALRRAGL